MKQTGFSPHVHLIAAWKVSEVEGYLRDRMFCRRMGQHVPLSMEEHPPSVKLNLAFKVQALSGAILLRGTQL